MQYKTLILLCPIWDLSCNDFLKNRTVIYLPNFYSFIVFLSTFWFSVELKQGQHGNAINPFLPFNFQAWWVPGRGAIGARGLWGPQSFSWEKELEVKDRKNKSKSYHSSGPRGTVAEESSKRRMWSLLRAQPIFKSRRVATGPLQDTSSVLQLLGASKKTPGQQPSAETFAFCPSSSSSPALYMSPSYNPPPLPATSPFCKIQTHFNVQRQKERSSFGCTQGGVTFGFYSEYIFIGYASCLCHWASGHWT